MRRTVQVALERDAVVVHLAQIAQRDNLESTRVGEDRPVPSHELVEPAEASDALVPRTQVKVIGVGEDDAGPGFAQVVWREALTVALVPTGMNWGVSTTP
jgi:hypothetical protein